VMEFARDPVELSVWQGSPEDEEEASALQEAYLARMRRLLKLRFNHREDLNEQGLWLLDRSIFATYRDCVELGVGFVAQEIIRRLSRDGKTSLSEMGDLGDPARRRER
jgi:hypothetical protein